ncbi:2-dehydro-3-deoxygalactonokinase [Pseudaestuariivita atlantica]|uniref:2-keto-3-deoxy-galactonokinase n=1 Tax=Pseudaestuariivita atlantica TaxID=1317121 RepID=A0A0L1JLL7_9RHOB|nr:2-dehydro-3-deoxygalactonokinase [Pseudaestuariivita atlantica]KNG92612.1 2-keto-3-deoxy-galactonokinase [Pseudaestuariivita atlantica]
MSAPVAWFAADWGTTHLRLWALDAGGTVVWSRDSDEGMGKLAPGGAFETALVRLIGADMPAGPVPVIVCGMAGSRQGWAEAPYATTPCSPPGLDAATRVPTAGERLRVHLLPGVKQDTPADVMRGEETQIAGLIARDPEFDGVVCLPGTHTKWVRISAREIVSFQTFMTGELFDLLSRQSVLRHGIGDGWDAAAFEQAVSDTLARPATIAAQLFGIRSSGLVAGLAGDAARSRLSGLLIGAELAGARPYWLGQRIAILGAEGVGDAYEAALAAQGAQVERVDAAGLTLDGLRAAWSALKEDA